eukprot:10365134-Alexandrium_andersonii.AAC.1
MVAGAAQCGGGAAASAHLQGRERELASRLENFLARQSLGPWELARVLLQGRPGNWRTARDLWRRAL